MVGLYSRVRRFVVPLLAIWLAAARARAEIPDDLRGLPVVAIEFVGQDGPERSPDALGVRSGDRLERELVRSAVHRLLDTGRYADVQVDAVPYRDGVKLVVSVALRTTLAHVEVTGNHQIDDASIEGVLRLAPGAELSVAQLQGFATAVARLYAERGYFDARVETALHPSRDPDARVLVVAISEGEPTRVRSLRFEGDVPLDPEAVLSSADLSVADVLDQHKLVDAIAKGEAFLHAGGYLEAELGTPRTTIDGRQADVLIPSHIGPRYNVVIRGYDGYSRGEIFDALGLERERLTELLMTQTLPERLKDFYARRGFREAEVRIERLAGKRRGTAVLVITIDHKQQRRVAAVSFAGARHFSRDFLRGQLSSYLREELPGSYITATVDSEVADAILQGKSAQARRSVPAPPITNPDEIYYAPVYGRAIDHIAELYRSDGYLEARVGPAQVEPIGRDRLAVLIPIVEGPQTRIHEVVIRGAHAFTDHQVLLAAGLTWGEPFSYLKLEDARRRVVDAYQEGGYMFAAAETQIGFSGDRTRAEVAFEITERVPVHIREIVIQGAERTDEDLIRRVIKLKPGDLFRPSLARKGERDLGLLQVFSGASITLKDPEVVARYKTVLVTVNERRNQFVAFSAGLSTGQGVRAGFEYGYRNLFGQAVAMSIRTQFAYQPFFVDPVIQQRFDALSVSDRLERRITLGTTIPRLPGLGGVRTSLDLVHLRSNARDFGLTQYAVALTFTHRPTDHLTFTLGGDLENNDLKLFPGEEAGKYLTDPRLRRLLRVSDQNLLPPSGAATLVSARLTTTYDLRDSPFTPTSGFFISGSAEAARTLSSEKHPPGTIDEFYSRFVKLSLTTSGYLPIARDVVLAVQARIGRIIHLNPASKTYPTRAFFLGGVDSLRGYLEDELVPQDIAQVQNLNANAIVRSGDAFVLYRAELRFPLYHELRGGVFTDLGNLWADARNIEPLKVRSTAGFGLRYDTAVGPLALDLGFNLRPRQALHERTLALHFAIGLF